MSTMHHRKVARRRRADPRAVRPGPGREAHFRSGLFTGWEIVDNTARLCAMNLLAEFSALAESLQGIGVDLDAEP